MVSGLVTSPCDQFKMSCVDARYIFIESKSLSLTSSSILPFRTFLNFFYFHLRLLNWLFFSQWYFFHANQFDAKRKTIQLFNQKLKRLWDFRFWDFFALQNCSKGLGSS